MLSCWPVAVPAPYVDTLPLTGPQDWASSLAMRACLWLPKAHVDQLLFPPHLVRSVTLSPMTKPLILGTPRSPQRAEQTLLWPVPGGKADKGGTL